MALDVLCDSRLLAKHRHPLEAILRVIQSDLDFWAANPYLGIKSANPGRRESVLGGVAVRP